MPDAAPRTPATQDAARVRRGRQLYGTRVGVLMVDTDLPRARGDIGNATTFPFPVAYGVAHGADPSRMVAVGDTGVADAFIEAADQITGLGVDALATSCGLLARDQDYLTSKLDVPVATSSLLFASTILRILPAARTLAVLTIDSRSLRDGGHLAGIGLTDAEVARIRIAGMEHTEHFHSVIMEGGEELDTAVAGHEVVAEARRVLDEDDTVGAFLLECTNLSPYTPLIQQATGLPVWDSTSLVRWLHEGYASSLQEGGRHAP